jgi:hypothetical protein
LWRVQLARHLPGRISGLCKLLLIAVRRREELKTVEQRNFAARAFPMKQPEQF